MRELQGWVDEGDEAACGTGAPPRPARAASVAARPEAGKLPPLEHPDRHEVRDISIHGGSRWNEQWVNVSTTCHGECVGLEEIDDGAWNLYYGALRLGRFHERRMKIEVAYGRLNRKS